MKSNYYRQHWRNIIREERRERIFHACLILLFIATMLATVAWTVTDTARIMREAKLSERSSHE